MSTPTPEQIAADLAVTNHQKDVKEIATEALHNLQNTWSLAIGECEFELLVGAFTAAMQADRDRAERGRCETCGANIYSGPPDCYICGAPNCCQQCCKIDSLSRQVDELRTRAEKAERELAEAVEALRPFAELGTSYSAEWEDDDSVETHYSTESGRLYTITAGHCRRAAEIIKKHDA